MASAEVAQLEQLCTDLQTKPGTEAQRAAEAMLRPFSTQLEYIPKCQMLLESSQNQYAQFMAASSLTKLITAHWSKFTVAQRIEIRHYCLNYLGNNGPGLMAGGSSFVVAAVIQLLCRITKLGWFDDDVIKNLAQDVKAMIFDFNSLPHMILGLKVALTCTQQANSGQLPFPDESTGQKLKTNALEVAHAALCFDFVGTCPDESSEEQNIVQIPASWRNIIQDPATLQVFLQMYMQSKPPNSHQAMECLVQLTSIRRTMFGSEEDRKKYLGALLASIVHVLSSKAGLDREENYHCFCRWLARLKSGYQLSELLATEHYANWIQLSAQFSVESLQSNVCGSNSVHYLLSLWSKLVNAMVYIRAGPQLALLEQCVPEVTKAYISSRVALVDQVVAGNIDDPLEEDDLLNEQLDHLPTLGRYQFEVVGAHVVQLLDPLLAGLTATCQALSVGQAPDPNQVAILKGKLTWLLYIIGSTFASAPISTQSVQVMSSSGSMGEGGSTPAPGEVDAQLAVRAFQIQALVDGTPALTPTHSEADVHLNSAMLYFFTQFRKIFIGDTSSLAGPPSAYLQTIYATLGAGMGDHMSVLNRMVEKIATNLQRWGDSHTVTHKTLALFYELANSHSSTRLMLTSNSINLILANHTEAHFQFMAVPSNGRLRTLYYAILGRLLTFDDMKARWEAFMAPFDITWARLGAGLQEAVANPAKLNDPDLQRMAVGLFRDLRGIIDAALSPRAYNWFFDWIYPTHFPVIQRCMEVWWHNKKVTSPILKFLSELSYNKSQRLVFNPSSPNGILLFREASQLICMFGNNVMQPAYSAQIAEQYDDKLKGVSACFNALSHSLTGRYVNFGVFKLYSDPALSSCMQVIVQLSQQINREHLMQYKKLAKSYFHLLEILLGQHITMLVEWDSATFMHLVGSLETGVAGTDAALASQCASALDHVVEFYFNALSNSLKPPEANEAMKQHIASQPELLPTLMHTLLNIILFEDCPNQWSLSRPLLGLVLTCPEQFGVLQQTLSSMAMANCDEAGRLERTQQLGISFEKLMHDVQPNLEPRNREIFTRNVNTFRTLMKQML